MCGLYLHFSKDSQLDLELCRVSLDTMTERGPDSSDELVLMDSKLYLGHRRLAIQDLSDAGRQPMVSQSGRYFLIFNGEIYNHFDLRKALQDASDNDIEWNGESDTETILVVIEKYGFSRAIDFLEGMFAICVFDSLTNTVLLARDRLGEKPLYYRTIDDSVEVSSTLHFLKYSPENYSSRLSSEALNSYLQKTFIPHHQCIFEGYHKVPPGSLVTISLDSGEVCKESYWFLPTIAKESQHDLAVGDVERILSSAVRSQLISDRPVGCFLSGGVDSSLISALASRHMDSKRLKTFTIGYEDNVYSEAIFAEEVASYLGTEHKTLIVTPDMIIDSVRNISAVYDEPFADYSQIPTFLLAKLSSDHVTVALSGDGGDELFGGYNRYKYYKYVNLLSKLPLTLRKKLNMVIQAADTSSLDKIARPFFKTDSPGIKIQKATNAILSSDVLNYYLSATNHGLKNSVMSRQKSSKSSVIASYFSSLVGFKDEEKLMLLDLYEYLPDDILVKVDRASMASSLECRAPFLDVNVVRVALGLHLKHKINKGNSKWILKEILGEYIPTSLFERPKMGFGFPLDKWLRYDLKEWAEDNLFADTTEVADLIDPSQVNVMWIEHQNGRNRFSELWAIIMLQAWIRGVRT